VTVGLPGAGVSAFFYLACAFLMPGVALLRMLRGQRVDRAQWWTILRQLGIATTVLLIILLTGWVVSALSSSTPAADGGATDTTTTTLQAVARLSIWLGIGTLVVVLLVVRLLAWYVRRQDRRAADQAVGSLDSSVATPASSDHAGHHPSSARIRSGDSRDERTSPSRGGP
jgi:hypothetical protein